MKKKYFVLAIFVLYGLLLNAQENLLDRQFYYYKGERFYLEVDYSRISVISEGKFNFDNEKKSVNSSAFSIKNEGKSFTRQNIVLTDAIAKMMQNKEIFIAEVEFSEILKQTDYQNIIQQLSKNDNIVKIMPTYTVSGQKLGISNNFYVKLFKEEDRNELFELAKKYSIQVLGYNEFMSLWFTLSCNRESSLNAIEAANSFYETGLFESAEPELLYHNLLATNDQYFPNQWGLKNTGQHCSTSNVDIRAESAWNTTTGSPNIRIAVFDHGIKMDHPDLINNIYGTGYDAETNTTPSILRNYHGTPCAGIAAAQQNNTIGISGVAPNCKLMSISINLSWGNTPQQLANGFSWAWKNGADVISNSWGGYAPSSIIENAIDSALIYGRNGLGCILVFCTQNWETSVAYPASLPQVIGVGAMSPKGERKSYTSCDGEYWWGSNYGDGLDIVAPGVFVPTTTWDGDYTQDFNGTSAATPHVAGVAALVLSVNPNLRAQHVRNVIESTAQQVGGYNYQIDPNRPDWNNQMGYGLVNAYAAVQKAVACPTTTVNFKGTVTNPIVVTTNRTVISCGDINVQYVKVQSGAKLILDAAGKVNIISDFKVEPNAELEIIK